MLRVYFNVSSFDNLITKQFLSHNAFGAIQFFCHIFASLTGPHLDGWWIRKGHDKEMSFIASQMFAKMKRYATAFAVTDTTGILLELISLIPVLEI